MKTEMQFDFLVDKEKNTMTIRREFPADRQLVWDAYTKSELLDQWFAPEPFKVRTKTQEFREGGFWLYAMISPDGAEFWARMDYQKIQAISSFTALDSFCNEKGELSPEMPRGTWNTTFSEMGENTLVQTIVQYESLAALETIVQMGMQEGLTATLNQLETLLRTFKK